MSVWAGNGPFDASVSSDSNTNMAPEPVFQPPDHTASGSWITCPFPTCSRVLGSGALAQSLGSLQGLPEASQGLEAETHNAACMDLLMMILDSGEFMGSESGKSPGRASAYFGG